VTHAPSPGRLAALFLALFVLAAPHGVRARDLAADSGPPRARADSTRARRAWPSSSAPGGSVGQPGRGGPPAGELDGSWREVAGPFDSPAVNRAPVVYDSRRHRMLLMDGDDFAVQWSLSLPATGTPQWSRRVVGGPWPAARIAFVAVYDSLRDRVVLHGGWDGTEVRGDTWALALGGEPRWTELLPSDAASPARDGHVGIVDPVRDRLVIFGGTIGACGGCRSADVWALGLTGRPHWERIAVNGEGPTPRTDAAAVYDPWLDLMVVFGGWVAGPPAGPSGETWVLRLGDSTWVPFNPDTRPSARLGPVAIADLAHERMVVQGGGSYYDRDYGLGDAWTVPLRGPAGWAPLATSGPAPVAFYHGAIYSPERHSMITYGGLAGAAAPNECDELDLDLGTWTHVSPTDDPGAPARQADDAMFVDPMRNEAVVMDGGETFFRCYSDPWTLPLTAAGGWVHGQADGVVPRCGRACLVYDSRRDRVLSLGGGDAMNRGGRVDEISALPLHSSSLAWQPLPIAGPLPVGRFAMSLVYDARRDRVLMFGGATWVRASDNSPASWDELWQLTLGDTLRWSLIATANSPGERWQAGAVIDTLRDRLVIHGGTFTIPGLRDLYPKWLYDTWTLSLADSLPEWRRIGPDAPAVSRPSYDDVSIVRQLVLDAARDRLLLVDTNLGAAYALPFEQPTEWKALDVQPNTFLTRIDASMALDAWNDRVLVFGGLARTLPRADLNALQLLPPTRMVAIDVEPERRGPGREPRSLRVTVHGSPSFSVDSLVRHGATLNGARVEFDEGVGRHAGGRDAGRWRDRDLVGHVPLRELGAVPADSVLAFAAFTPRGTRIAGYTRLRLSGLAGSAPASEDDGLDDDRARAPGLRAINRLAPGVPLAFAYTLPSRDPARLELLDVMGRRVSAWPVPVGTDRSGGIELPESRALAPGVYLARLIQGASVFTARVVVLR